MLLDDSEETMFQSIRQAVIIVVISLLISTLTLTSFANDTMNASQSITYNRTLVSSGEIFEMGFFSPGNSKNWYLGIWYNNIPQQTVVWVANRGAPLGNSSSGVLRIIEPGILVLLNGTNHTVWSSSMSTSADAGNPFVQLLDSGNLVVRDADDDPPWRNLWQSFDYPTDTFLPGMKFGLDSVYMTSWKSNEDPSPGDYILYVNQSGYPQVFTKKGGVDLYRRGPWNGLLFSGTPNINNNPSFIYGMSRNEEGQFYVYEEVLDVLIMSRITVDTMGTSRIWNWVDQTREWVPQMNFPVDNCDAYGTCGAHGVCTVGKFPICSCLDKFEPKDPKGWAQLDWSTNGCIRRTPLNCAAGDGFKKYSNLKMPDARRSWYDERMTLQGCRAECSRNCSCTAYTTLNISGGGSGCLLYFGDLVDMRYMSQPIVNQDLYIKIAFSELDTVKKINDLIVSMTTIGAALLGLSVALCIWKRMKNRTGRKSRRHDKDEELPLFKLELPLFEFLTISKATNEFSSENKIGEGGYGPVYKGTLEDGQDIAVKRQSESSRQGFTEFKNEVLFVAKLQHRNLVKLLGCCIHGEEKMLIYEHMPNGSLDTVLFDPKNGAYLDWPTRFHIVNGIVRGLMYLHEDSRLKIIHRDLKASNILLDHNMHAKISDFGIAKNCKGNDIEVTRRVMGTYGYMSPEYVTYGRFSVKSDVFSLGVIVLEIASGRRSSSYSLEDCHLNLLAHAWTLYREGRSIELVDSYLQNSDSLDQVLRLIHIGLLCVQQQPQDRPSMTCVVSMLSNDDQLPQPTQPGFFMRGLNAGNVRSNRSCSNEMTITMLDGR